MARTEHYYTKLLPGNFYHVYNRCVDRKPLFTQKRNYYFFKTRMVKYLFPILDVYAFCLLNNHFHLLVKIKDSHVFEPILEKLHQYTSEQIVSMAFKKMFQSYAMAFNKQENRIGALFQEPFKRCLIDSDVYLKYLTYYIHTNPQKHGLTKNSDTYPYSSFHLYINQINCDWTHDELYDLFGGYDDFIYYHNNYPLALNYKHIIEDDP